MFPGEEPQTPHRWSPPFTACLPPAFPGPSSSAPHRARGLAVPRLLASCLYVFFLGSTCPLIYPSRPRDSAGSVPYQPQPHPRVLSLKHGMLISSCPVHAPLTQHPWAPRLASPALGTDGSKKGRVWWVDSHGWDGVSAGEGARPEGVSGEFAEERLGSYLSPRAGGAACCKPRCAHRTAGLGRLARTGEGWHGSQGACNAKTGGGEGGSGHDGQLVQMVWMES